MRPHHVASRIVMHCFLVCVYMLYTQDVVSRVASGSSLFLLHGRAFKVAMCLLHQLYEVE